jgi:hypothetical protein
MFDGVERNFVSVWYEHEGNVAHALVELTDDPYAIEIGYFPEWFAFEEQFVYYTATIQELVAMLGVNEAFGDATLVAIDGYAMTAVYS